MHLTERTKLILIVGFIVLWASGLFIGFIFKIPWLAMTGVVITIAMMAIGDASRNIEARRAAKQAVKENGTDWAIKELVSNPGMNSAKSEGLREGLKSYENTSQ